MRYLTAGESHGKGLVGILDGMPANVKIDVEKINCELARRQKGYGRGKRMSIETDKIDVYGGIRNGYTTGAPIAFIIQNKDYEKWVDIMGTEHADTSKRTVTCVRPGHADLSGCVKYNQTDARNILERASARETAARVAIGAICKQFLESLDIFVGSHVINIGGEKSNFVPENAKVLIEKSDDSVVRCMDANSEKTMIAKIDEAIRNKDTVGGVIEVVASGLPIGLGSCMQSDRKLGSLLSAELGGIQAVKSVEFGLGREYAEYFGSQVHDQMYVSDEKFYRKTNSAGGLEGGMTNGENLVVKVTVKPIPTVMKGLETIDFITKKNALSDTERSDYCAVPAAGVVCENVVSYALTNELLVLLGGDNMEEISQRFKIKKEVFHVGAKQ